MSNHSKNNVRRAAVSALRAWSKGHDYAETLIERHSSRNNLSSQDRNLLNSILMAVIRNKSALDFWISRLRKGKLDDDVRDILRVGLAQLLLLGIPDHAAVNETVNCGKSAVRGLLNAVMRNAVNKRKRLFDDLEKESNLAIEFSTPEWLVKHWTQIFGSENTEYLLAWNNQPAEVYFRFNPIKPELKEGILAEENITALEEVPGYFRIKGKPNNQWLANGAIYIQDPSTQYSVKLLAPQPGETILDACAAPGGKAAFMGSMMNNEGRLICTDGNEKRLNRLKDNLINQGISIAEVSHWDWTQEPPQEWHEKFDAILLDVPCSNTGVFRRRVDARWRMRQDAIEQLESTQLAILQHAALCLAPGGRIIYSTCSIEPEENEGIIQKFIEQNNFFTLKEEHKTTPWTDTLDGSYAARLEFK